MRKSDRGVNRAEQIMEWITHLEAFSLITSAVLLPFVYFRDCCEVHRDYARFCREVVRQGPSERLRIALETLRSQVALFTLEVWFLMTVAIFFALVFMGSQIWGSLTSKSGFSELDVNGDLVIDKSEFDHFNGVFNFVEFDKDKDGLVKKEEFLGCLTKPVVGGIPNVSSKWLFCLDDRNRQLASRCVLIGGLVMQGFFFLRTQTVKRRVFSLMTDYGESEIEATFRVHTTAA